MDKWEQIQNQNDRFRLLCEKPDCSTSILNISKGIISISSIHNGFRHTTQFSPQDMLFIVSQYLNSLSKEDRERLLEFFKSF